jgi:hypothetical protein
VAALAVLWLERGAGDGFENRSVTVAARNEPLRHRRGSE